MQLFSLVSPPVNLWISQNNQKQCLIITKISFGSFVISVFIVSAWFGEQESLTLTSS